MFLSIPFYQRELFRKIKLVPHIHAVNIRCGGHPRPELFYTESDAYEPMVDRALILTIPPRDERRVFLRVKSSDL